MSFKMTAVAGVLFSALLTLPGCAADSSSSVDEASEEEAAASEDALHANARLLVGTYRGNAERIPAFQGVVFKSDGTFFADVDTGIRCVQAPCPSSVHLEGRYTATQRFVRLMPASGSPSNLHGAYRYHLSSGHLTLAREALGQGWQNTFDKVDGEGTAPWPVR